VKFCSSTPTNHPPLEFFYKEEEKEKERRCSKKVLFCDVQASRGREVETSYEPERRRRMWVLHSTSRGAGPFLACLILVGATHLSSLGEERMHLRCTNIPCLRGCIQDSAMHLGLRGGSDIVPEDVEGVSSLDEDKEVEDDRIHWRGKEGGEDDGERMSLEKRLRDLREMYEQGVLDKGEHDKEKARLLEACAMVGEDLDEIYRHDDEKDDFERYKDAENYTIARRANNNMAKKMAYGCVHLARHPIDKPSIHLCPHSYV
jgi:hypothetical protein